MNTIEFDALRWINQYLDYQIKMDEEDLKQLEIFTFMWDMFEAKACNGVANAQSITDFVLNKSSFKESGSSVLDAYYDYFNKRYPKVYNEILCPKEEEAILIKYDIELEKKIKIDFPIDVVFSWVNDNDLNWKNKYNKYNKKSFRR